MQITKTVKPAFELLDSILNSENILPVNWPFDAENLKIKHENRKIYIDFIANNDRRLHDAYLNRLPQLSIETNQIKIDIPSGQAWFNCPFQHIVDHLEMEIEVTGFHTSNFEEEEIAYLRVFQPIDRFNLHRDINTAAYYEGSYWRRGLMQIDLKGLIIEAFPYDYNKQQYIVFECKQPISAKAISDKIFSICAALGLISKEIWLDEAITIKYQDANFEVPIALRYQSLRPTIKGSFDIFSTNVYSIEDTLTQSDKTRYAIAHLKNDTGELKKDMINWLQQDFISALCSLMDSDDSLRRAAVMVTEASTSPVEYQVSMYSTALESITSYYKKIYGHEFPTPLPKDMFKKEIVGKFMVVLEEFEVSNPELKDGINIIRNKFKNLNSPTNLDKLITPFTEIGYTLSDLEKSTIKNRNLFQHGQIVSSTEKEDEFDSLFKTCVRFHKLCCILILKQAGFSNYILNNPVLYGFDEECSAKQPPIISI